MSGDLFEQLMSETLDQTALNGKRDPFIFEEDLPEIQEENEKTTGVLFYIEMGEFTFCVRCLPTRDLKSCWGQWLRGEERLLEALRLDPSQEVELMTFGTENFEEAEYITKQVANRRFPKGPSQLLGLGDPSSHWKGRVGVNSVEIFFNALEEGETSQTFELGPLGDDKLFLEKMHREILADETIFDLEDIYMSNKRILMQGKPDDEVFEQFGQVMLNGASPKGMYSSLAGRMSPDFYQLLSSLAVMRRFWKDVQNALDEECQKDLH